MVELVDTRDLGSRALGRAGSTPVPGTSNLPVSKQSAEQDLTLDRGGMPNHAPDNCNSLGKPIGILQKRSERLIPHY